MGWISLSNNSILGRPPEVSIAEDTDGLLIKVALRRRFAAVVSAIATTGCALIVADAFVPHRLMLIIVALAALLGVVMSMREQTVELRVNNLDFETLGYFGGSYRRRRTEPRMSIRGMEHRTSENVPGLYADMPFYWACLLPFVSEQQANEIIERIYRKFPDTPVAADPFTENLTTLELD
ncbi:MAG: hypothetical protein ROO76_21185 [Terriglobia bacterium]|nr:hypothetical protein [Terriglobia bacterium]